MNEDIEAFREKRILRIKQVREQSKEIAKKLRCKLKEEREKQTAIISAKEEDDFQKLKQNSIKSLQEKYENRALTLGSSHAAVSAEENLEKEWSIQKEYNIRQAAQRGKSALKNTKKNEKTTKSDSIRNRNKFNSRKELSSNVNYKENDEAENACGNIFNSNINSNIQSPLLSCNSETFAKRSADKHSVQKVSINDIQKALCDCQPHFESVITNVEQMLNNNTIDKLHKASTVNNKPTIEIANTDTNTIYDKIDESSKYKPLNIVSEYLKNKRVHTKTVINSESENIVKSPREDASNLNGIRDVINHARCLSNVKFDEIQEKPAKRTKFADDRRSVSKNHVLNSPRLKTKVSKWKSKQNQAIGGRSVKSYDQYNKFSKNIIFNDEYLVRKIPRGDFNAYESAEREIRDDEMIAASIQSAKKNDKSKTRGRVAMEKVRLEDDYKSLLRELDTFDKEERSIGKPKINRRSFQDNDERQRRINRFVENLFSKQNSSDSKDVEKDPNDRDVETVNVATWDVCSEIRTINVSEKSSIDSENSSRSIIIQTYSQTNNKVSSQKTETKSKQNDNNNRTPNKKKKKTISKVIQDPSNSTEDDYNETSDVKIHKKDRVNRVTSSSSTISFEGLQIVIEVKKAKKDASKYRNVQSKTSKIHTSNMDIQQNIDSSESTCYMSPPDKINTYLEQFFSKGIPDHQKHVSDRKSNTNLKTTNVGVNTDLICSESKIQKDAQTSVDVKIDPRLEKYVKILLGMSEGEIKKLDANISDVTTPNSSVINAPSNKMSASQNFLEKIEKLKDFIRENYSLLDDLKKHTSSGSSSPIESIKNKTLDELDFNVNKIPVQIQSESIPNQIQDVSGNSEMFVILHAEDNKKDTSDELNSIDEKLNTLSEEFSQRILNISKKIDKVRDDDANSDDFVPLLKDIPKPNDSDSNKSKPPLVINNNARNKNLLSITPHELSTIIEVDTPATVKSSKNVNISPLRLDDDDDDNNTNMKPFISFKDYLNKAAEVEDSEDNSSGSNDSVHRLAVKLLKEDVISKFQHIDSSDEESKSKSDISGVHRLHDTVDSLTPELENFIRNIAPDWKKIQEALSSGSSANKTISTVGLSTFRDDLNLTDELLRSSAVENISNESLNVKVNELLKELKSAKSVVNAESGKVQHRTSTPVQVSHSSNTAKSSGSSNCGSNGVFAIESDLSSVRNSSQSDKNLSSDDRLSVPNLSLKFRKLFDSNSSVHSE